MKKIHKKWLTAGSLWLLPLLLYGCGGLQTGPKTENVQQESVFTFTDDLGREVSVDVGASLRAASLIGSFADIWMLAGGEVCAAANDSWEGLNLPLGEDVVNLGSLQEPDVEKLIASEPDLVLASVNMDGDLAMEELLAQAGIPTAYFAVSNFGEYLHMLDICTQITGQRDLYRQNGIKVQEQIEEIKERIDGREPVILLLRASSSNVKAKGSKGNVCGEMLLDLGCINIADNNEGLLEELGMEAVLLADPDFIFVVIQGNNQEAAMENVEELLMASPAWAALRAVKEGNYYLLDKRLYNIKPNARWGEAYAGLADILYPAR